MAARPQSTPSYRHASIYPPPCTGGLRGSCMLVHCRESHSMRCAGTLATVSPVALVLFWGVQCG